MRSNLRGFQAFLILSIVACGNKSAGEEQAREYAKALGIKIHGVTCMRDDTDDDGYVSCNMSIADNNGKVTIQPIECAVKWTMNTGCRIPKFNPSVR